MSHRWSAQTPLHVAVTVQCELADCPYSAPASMWHHLRHEGYDCMRICVGCYGDLHGTVNRAHLMYGDRTPIAFPSCPDCRRENRRKRYETAKAARNIASIAALLDETAPRGKR